MTPTANPTAIPPVAASPRDTLPIVPVPDDAGWDAPPRSPWDGDWTERNAYARSIGRPNCPRCQCAIPCAGCSVCNRSKCITCGKPHETPEARETGYCYAHVLNCPIDTDRMTICGKCKGDGAIGPGDKAPLCKVCNGLGYVYDAEPIEEDGSDR